MCRCPCTVLRRFQQHSEGNAKTSLWRTTLVTPLGEFRAGSPTTGKHRKSKRYYIHNGGGGGLTFGADQEEGEGWVLEQSAVKAWIADLLLRPCDWIRENEPTDTCIDNRKCSANP